MKLLNYLKRGKTSPRPQAQKEKEKSAIGQTYQSEPEAKPMVIYFDTEAFDRAADGIEFLLPKIGKIHSELSRFLPRSLTIDELRECFVNTGEKKCPSIVEALRDAPSQRIDEILLDVILEESEMKLNGIQLDRDQARKLVNFPELRPIKQKIADVCFNPIPGMESINWKFFQVKDGKVTQNPESIKAYRESLTIYTTDEQRERMTAANEVSTAIEKMEKSVKDYSPGAFEIPGAIIYDSYQKKYRPVISLITRKRKEEV